MLQAESEKLRQAWIQAVQASIASAYREITDNYYIEVSNTTCMQLSRALKQRFPAIIFDWNTAHNGFDGPVGGERIVCDCLVSKWECNLMAS